jgi:uncharacterized membrane protein
MIKSKELCSLADGIDGIDSNNLESKAVPMPFSLVKAVKSTHRHPLNKILHAIGLLLYIFAIYIIVSYLSGQHDQNPTFALVLWLSAIGLFVLGHRIDGNVRAMTIIVLFEYFKSKLQRSWNKISR